MGNNGVTLDDGTGPVTADATGSQTVTPSVTTTYTLTATNSCGPVTQSVTVTVSDSPTVDSFTASPTAICNGDSTILSWGTTGATSMTIDDGSGAVETTETNKTVTPTSTTTYTLTAINGCGSDSKTVTVTVNNAPVIESFTASDICTNISGSADLSWSVIGADSVSIDKSVGDVNPASGTYSVSPSVDTTYTLTATNSCSEVPTTATVTIAVKALPVINSFTISKDTICKGLDTIDLAWSVDGADSLTINNEVGTVTNTTSKEGLAPTASTTYTLTATNSCGSVTADVSVTVNDKPVISSFTAADSTVCPDGSTTLNWDVTDADTISIDNGVVIGEGTSVTVHPAGTTTYTLSATNTCGTTTKSVTVSVTAAPAIGTFTATNATICSGSQTTLQWSDVTGASSLSIDNSVGTVTETSESVSPTVTTTYTLTATNSCGVTDTKTVTVNVTAMPVISDFTATPDSICKGQSTTLASTVTGATTITIDHGVGTVGGGTSTAVVSPTTTTTYTLTASNGDCQVTETVTVTVNDKPVITSFTASPTNVLAGGDVTLSWAITNATGAAISGVDSPVNASSGTIVVNPTEDTPYTLTATNGCGDTTSDVTVTVILNNPPDKPVMSSPTDGATGVSLMPELTAGAYNDADGDPQTMTWWQISTDSTFTDDGSLVYDEKTDTYLTSIVVPPNLILDVATMYYWRVRYFDGKNWSDSDVYSFTTTPNGAQYTDGVQNGDRIPDNEVTIAGFADEHGKPVNTPTKKAFVSKVNKNIQIGVEAADAVIDRCGSVDPKDFKDMAPKVPHMPYGLIEIALTVPNPGDTATVTVYFTRKLPNANDFVWWKYDPNLGEFYNYGEAAAALGVADAVVVSEDRMSVTLKFKDGGYGDLIETPDSRIIDPSGVGDEGGGSNGGTCFVDTITR